MGENGAMTTRPQLLLWLGFVVDSVVQVGAQAVAPTGIVSILTQALLAPLLLSILLTSGHLRDRRVVRVTMVALVMCFIGDLVPSLLAYAPGFKVMVFTFLAAQICFAAAFWPFRASSVLSGRPWLIVLYALGLGVLLTTCMGSAGNLWAPLTLYGLCLMITAVLASGLGVLGTVGGALFFVSDALIAIGAFAPSIGVPHIGVWIMAPYAAALALFTAAVLTAPVPVAVPRRVDRWTPVI